MIYAVGDYVVLRAPLCLPLLFPQRSAEGCPVIPAADDVVRGPFMVFSTTFSPQGHQTVRLWEPRRRWMIDGIPLQALLPYTGLASDIEKELGDG